MTDGTYHCCKKSKNLSSSSSRSWSELPVDLLIWILKRLNCADVVRFGAVSCNWSKGLAQVNISPTGNFLQAQALAPVPWLLLPLTEGSEDQRKDSSILVSCEEKREYKSKNISLGFGESRRIGSSHGWLILLDQDAKPYLLNPLSRLRIELPSLETLEDVLFITESGCIVVDSMNPSNYNDFISIPKLREVLIHKAILSADPLHSNDKYGVIVIYNDKSNLAYWTSGKESWADFSDARGLYRDIICNKNNKVYTLSDTFSVEEWDFSQYYPIKKTKIQPTLPREFWQFYQTMYPLYEGNWYLVQSSISSEFLLVFRLIVQFANWYNGLPVLPALPGLGLGPPTRYQTALFQVFRLDFHLKEWVQINSLGAQALVLGGNHSISVSTMNFPKLTPNSIYFTDDYWSRINEHRTYGGHDMGIFMFGDRRIIRFRTGKIEPPPFWIVPNPWKKQEI